MLECLARDFPEIRNCMAGHRKLASFQLVQLTKHGVLHDDLHQGNLIMSNGWLFAIDFDRALISSEEAEVAAYVEWLREELVLQVSHSCFWCSDCWGASYFYRHTVQQHGHFVQRPSPNKVLGTHRPSQQKLSSAFDLHLACMCCK
jgi:thiamine kinase-like enzyme